MGKLEGRVALITGSARGLGAGMAQRFVELGAKVAVSDVLDEEGEKVAAGLGHDATFIPLDVTSEQGWERAVATVTGHFGGLDVLVNNAGVVLMALIVETELADFRRVVEINQTGVFLGMRAAAPVMRPGSAIVNISSVDGLVGTPGLIAYVASKFAVRGMTKVAAMELAGRGITVNSIHPGTVDTPMLNDPLVAESGALDLIMGRIPLNRVAHPNEVADTAAFLASEESRYCTGSEFTIDGGLTAGTYFPMA